MKIFKNDEAVSPVIGVILMVAITVILAAVIAAFVFGLAGSTGSSKNVGMVVQANGTYGVTVTIQGGTDLPAVTNLSVSNDGNNYYSFALSSNETKPEVGKVYALGIGSPAGKRIIIKGDFTDGSTQILYDRNF